MSYNNANGNFSPYFNQPGSLSQQQQMQNQQSYQQQQQAYSRQFQGQVIPMQLGAPNNPFSAPVNFSQQNERSNYPQLNFPRQMSQNNQQYSMVQQQQNQQFQHPFQQQQNIQSRFQQPPLIQQQQPFIQQQLPQQQPQQRFQPQYESEMIVLKGKDLSMRVLKTKYICAKEIGKGSFAKVYSGVDSETGERVAIKKIDKKKFDSSYLDLIDSEIAVLSQLKNEHIIQFKDLFAEGDFIYIVTELCELGDLEVFINKNFQKTNKKLPEQLVKIFSYQILLAFLGIGDKEIIHRDMKLSNVLISSELLVKVADFGLAKSSNEKDTDQVGTPMTMAPEVLLSKDYDAKCDVWSMGCMIFEMLEGRSPFQPSPGGGLVELKRLVRERRLIFRNLDISNEAKDLIDQMLTVDPSQRISWNQMFTHDWFADCVQNGDPFIQKIARQYSNLQDNDQIHLDPEFAEEFGISLRDFSNYCMNPFIIELGKTAGQLIKILNGFQGNLQQQYGMQKKQSNSNNNLAFQDNDEDYNDDYENNNNNNNNNNNSNSQNSTEKQKLLIQIQNGLKLINKVASMFSRHRFIFKYKKQAIPLPLSRLCRDNLSSKNITMNQDINNNDDRSPSQIIEELIITLLELCEKAMEVDFEIFKSDFAQVVAFINLMLSNKTGFVMEIKVDESEQNLTQKDADRLQLINIQRAYVDEKSNGTGIVKKNIIFIKKMAVTKYQQDKNIQEDIADRIVLLSDVVFGYQQQISQVK